MKEKELCLIKHLREDGRKSLTDISKETEIPVSTLFTVLRKLEEEIIAKHTSLLDFSKIGYSIKTHFVLSSDNKKELKKYLMSNKHVNTLQSLMNDSDFYVECIFKDMAEMSDFKEDLNKKNAKINQENFVVDEIKREEFVL